MNANFSTNEMGPRWGIAAVVLVALGLSWAPKAHAEDMSHDNTAHQFETGPVVPQTVGSGEARVGSVEARAPRTEDVARIGGVDRYALAQAVWSVLRYDSSKLEFEEVRPIVELIIEESEGAGIDPFIAVTIVFLESRFKVKATGDGGRACGMAQQHAKFSMKWGLSNTMSQFQDVRDPTKRFRAQHDYECELLRDPVYATKVMIYHLQIIERRAKPLTRYVWFYNGRENYLTKHLYWKGQTEDVYDRILEKRAASKAQATLEAEIRATHTALEAEMKTSQGLARNP